MLLIYIVGLALKMSFTVKVLMSPVFMNYLNEGEINQFFNMQLRRTCVHQVLKI